MLGGPASDTQITHLGRLWLYIFGVLVLLFLLGPIFIVIPMSFSDSTYLRFPPETWSLLVLFNGRSHRRPNTMQRILTVLLTAAACGSSESPLLIKTDLRPGTGAEATTGTQVSVHYTGWLQDTSKTDGKGTQFDSSVGGPPFGFRLGGGQVIAGWDQQPIYPGLHDLTNPTDLCGNDRRTDQGGFQHHVGETFPHR